MGCPGVHGTVTADHDRADKRVCICACLAAETCGDARERERHFTEETLTSAVMLGGLLAWFAGAFGPCLSSCRELRKVSTDLKQGFEVCVAIQKWSFSIEQVASFSQFEGGRTRREALKEVRFTVITNSSSSSALHCPRRKWRAHFSLFPTSGAMS